MVTDLHGLSLKTLFNYCNGKFSLKTVLMLTDQLISHLQTLSSKGIIHRALTPSNLCMGLGKKGETVHLVEFGLAKKFIDPRTGGHIPYKEGKGFLGSIRFGSVNKHFGIELSRRDDLESLAYILIFLLKGSLPWEKTKCKDTKEKVLKARQIKLDCSPSELTKGLPGNFQMRSQVSKSVVDDHRGVRGPFGLREEFEV